MSRIVVAGAGVTGLSIAHAIRQRDPRADVVVIEGNNQPGGNVKTEIVDGYLCEWGADGFLDNAPDTLRLVQEIGLQDRLLPSRDSARRRFIYSKGVLHEVPGSPLAFLRSGLLSPAGRARIAWEPFARRRPVGDETIHDFAARRIGGQAASVMIDSMVSGIFAGDARALSLRACFPKMWQMETDHGGLFRALIATRKRRRKEDAIGAPGGRLTSFVGGMAELINALAATLGSAVRVSSPVIELQRGGFAQAFQPGSPPTGYTVVTSRGRFEADAVVLCTQRLSDDTLYHQLKADEQALRAQGIEALYRIGDCVAPRLIADVIFDGHRLAREIDTNNPATPLPYKRERMIVSPRP